MHAQVLDTSHAINMSVIVTLIDALTQQEI